MTTVPLYTYKLLNSQNQRKIGLLNHLTQQVFIFNIEFFSTFLKKCFLLLSLLLYHTSHLRSNTEISNCGHFLM